MGESDKKTLVTLLNDWGERLEKINILKNVITNEVMVDTTHFALLLAMTASKEYV